MFTVATAYNLKLAIGHTLKTFIAYQNIKHELGHEQNTSLIGCVGVLCIQGLDGLVTPNSIWQLPDCITGIYDIHAHSGCLVLRDKVEGDSFDVYHHIA